MAKVIVLKKEKGNQKKGAKGYLSTNKGRMYFKPFDDNDDDEPIEIYKGEYQSA